MDLDERGVFLQALVNIMASINGRVTICDERKNPIPLYSTHNYVCLLFGLTPQSNNSPVTSSLLNNFEAPSEKTHKLRVYAQKEPGSTKCAYGNNFTLELANKIAKCHIVEVVFIKHSYKIQKLEKRDKSINISNLCHCNLKLNKEIGDAIMEWCKSYICDKFSHAEGDDDVESTILKQDNINKTFSFVAARNTKDLTSELLQMNERSVQSGNFKDNRQYINRCKKMAHKVGILIHYNLPNIKKNVFKQKLNKLLKCLKWSKINQWTCSDMRRMSTSLNGHIGLDDDGELWLDLDGASLLEILPCEYIPTEEDCTFFPTLHKEVRVSLEGGRYIPMEILLYQLAVCSHNQKTNKCARLSEVPENYIVSMKKTDVMRAINIQSRYLSKKYSSILSPYLEFIDSIWKFMYSYNFKVEAAMELYNRYWKDLNRNLARGQLNAMNIVPKYILEEVTKSFGKHITVI